MTNLQLFKDTYVKHLKRARETQPDLYSWPESELPAVTARMLAAIDKRSFNKDSIAFKWTCVELKIKHTFKAIEEFIK